MNEHDVLAERFEAHRPRLRALAYQTLGSPSEAEAAVQEAWLRLSRTDPGSIENLGGWLTTVVARVCLNMLAAHRDEPVGVVLPESVVSDADGSGPEHEALLAASIGPALLVIMHTMAPAERLAFVLHDIFAVPFDEVAAVVGRSPAAARQLASRARRRVQGASAPEVDLPTQRRLVDAFIAALRSGDMEALVAVLDPDVVVRVDGPGAAAGPIRGAREWARGAVNFQRAAEHMRPVLVDGRVGLAFAPGGKVVRVLVFGFAGETIRDAEVVSEPDALAELVIEMVP